MVDYLILPIIGLIVALQAMRRVQAQTGSNIASGVAGLAGFLFCLGMSGHLFYGCLLATLLAAALIVYPKPQELS